MRPITAKRFTSIPARLAYKNEVTLVLHARSVCLLLQMVCKGGVSACASHRSSNACFLNRLSLGARGVLEQDRFRGKSEACEKRASPRTRVYVVRCLLARAGDRRAGVRVNFECLAASSRALEYDCFPGKYVGL